MMQATAAAFTGAAAAAAIYAYFYGRWRRARSTAADMGKAQVPTLARCISNPCPHTAAAAEEEAWRPPDGWVPLDAPPYSEGQTDQISQMKPVRQTTMHQTAVLDAVSTPLKPEEREPETLSAGVSPSAVSPPASPFLESGSHKEVTLRTSLDTLPFECGLLIFDFIGHRNVGKAARTCHAIRTWSRAWLVRNDGTLPHVAKLEVAFARLQQNFFRSPAGVEVDSALNDDHFFSDNVTAPMERYLTRGLTDIARWAGLTDAAVHKSLQMDDLSIDDDGDGGVAGSTMQVTMVGLCEIERKIQQRDVRVEPAGIYSELVRGTQVQIIGIHTSASLNGRRGIVRAFDCDSQRYRYFHSAIPC
jgi:hypothetical protein